MLNDLSNIEIPNSIVNPEILADYKISKGIQRKLNETFGQDHGFNAYTSYIETAKATSVKPANIATIPNQYFIFAAKMYDFAIELYKYFDIYEKIRSTYGAKLLGEKDTITTNVRSDTSLVGYFENNSDIDLFAKFLDKDDNSYRFGSKRLVNDQGVARGSRDCFASVILKNINIPDTSSNVFGGLVYDLCLNIEIYDEIRKNVDSYCEGRTVNSSTKLIKNSKIRYFAKDAIAYFHKEHHSEFISATNENSQNSSKIDLPNLKNVIKMAENKLTFDELSSGEGNTQRFFEDSLIEGGEYWYVSTQWVGDGDVASQGLSFTNLKKFIEEAFKGYSVRYENNLYILSMDSNLKTYPLSKPFLLLAGVSGTGKSHFVREQAKKTDPSLNNFCLTPVRPDWHEPSDLLGYVSRLGHDGAEFISTDVLNFIVKAWKEINPSHAELESGAFSNRGVVPFWLCLDEMNLAPVEQYFADYLAIVETRQWKDGVYNCDALLKPEVIGLLSDDNQSKLREDWDLADDGLDELWSFFLKYGVPIPFNLIVAGTVNMDETTHGFSRKVVDRALSFDFGQFFPNDFDEFFTPTKQAKVLGYPLFTQASRDDFSSIAIDADAQKTIKFIQDLNTVLNNTLFELAYRALNELLLSVICFQPQSEQELLAVWDDFLMFKVLPRIEGDEDKLTSNGRPLLKELSTLLSQQELLGPIWASNRPDLLREEIGSASKAIEIGCRSQAKLAWMEARLAHNGFTSFWP